MQEIFRRVICNKSKQECPYHKDHCCLGEIDVRSLNDEVPLTEKHCCKQKSSIKVIGVLEKAA